LLTETKDGIATLTRNRPGQFNALSSALIDELQSTFDRLGADATVRVVVLAARRAASVGDAVPLTLGGLRDQSEYCAAREVVLARRADGSVISEDV
jgi:enoyl-CoA hydratase/carnithine racemase